jgi:hypothetical protein
VFRAEAAGVEEAHGSQNRDVAADARGLTVTDYRLYSKIAQITCRGELLDRCRLQSDGQRL